MEPSKRDSWPRIQVPDRVLKQVPWPFHANRLQAGRCRYVRERVRLSDLKVNLDLQNIHLIFFSARQGNCPSQVCTCRSRTRSTDECEIARAKSDKYYLVLYVDKDHVDLKLSIEAFNLKAVYPITE